jgi:hypothetical protein
VVVCKDNEIQLIDFDRAKLGSLLTVSIADWLGVMRSGLSENPYWKLFAYTFYPKTRSAGVRARNKLGIKRRMMPTNPTEPDLQALQSAWARAEKSEANAPKQQVAYYSLTYKNWHFLGERPWYLRWEAIRNHVEFDRKRVIELGCNMGLFSIYSKLHGAKTAKGVDRDPIIVEVAKQIASVMKIDADFKVVDLLADKDWEQSLQGGDMVVAMSLIHWLPKKERVLKFIGSHNEVIFEGHNSLDVELARLRSHGFGNLKVLTETERGRHVIYGRK